MGKTTVLVVDDDPISLEVVKERLERIGYEVVGRDQALGTSEYIAKHQPDLALLDIMMPGLSGDRLAELLHSRDRTRAVPVILYSSKSPDELQDLVRKSGAIGAIEKTSDDDQFFREFRRLASRTKNVG